MALAGAMNVSVETSTSSSGCTPATSSATCSAAVPLTVGDGVLRAERVGRHALEAVDEGADRRDPAGIEAILDVVPRVAARSRARTAERRHRAARRPVQMA